MRIGAKSSQKISSNSIIHDSSCPEIVRT